MADGIERELEALKVRWEKERYFPAVIEAFEWCTLNDRVLPEWVAEAAYSALILAANQGGRSGRGKTGSFLHQARRLEKDEARWNAASRALAMKSSLSAFGAYKPNREGAFERASDLLAGSPAQGSREAIERSYNRIQRKKRCAKSTN